VCGGGGRVGRGSQKLTQSHTDVGSYSG
jgi:hypothetical protein